ncbi:MAG: CPBP family intramembrane metalloprotease [Anaerolineales bacterium]|nr:CPBP family intramembrane metalloprotease [Anaerolineales bacterium]
MAVETSPTANPHSRSQTWLVIAAWIGVLLVSSFPEILFDALGASPPAWLAWAKPASMALLLALCLVWQPLRLLWQFAAVMLVFSAGDSLAQAVFASPTWQGRFAGSSFFTFYMSIFVVDFALAAAVLAALWLVKRRRQDFYLTRGQLDAPVEPVRWLGIKPGESWRVFGWIFAGCAMLAVFFPTILALRPSGDQLARALPLLPAAILFAAINAFNEEAYFRLSTLATLPQAVGRTQAMLLNVTLFGLAHYLYGSPGGILGFLMTAFLAFLMGKAVLETRGLFWAWLIHLLPDVVVFFSYALGWVG